MTHKQGTSVLCSIRQSLQIRASALQIDAQTDTAEHVSGQARHRVNSVRCPGAGSRSQFELGDGVQCLHRSSHIQSEPLSSKHDVF